ncbi:signal recognition particle-docking protein FtsY [Streptococcus mutans]|uniref:signal recognition particle-docking protein FtsY n=1 Tax=Streptococcus mutans TaxID=1309 RepID=UPI000467434A|nr:signal recognition particle-docking protein FtsY [Streptococcus mutans]
MGLFNRLFGKKRQEEKPTTDSIEETAEQEVTQEKPALSAETAETAESQQSVYEKDVTESQAEQVSDARIIEDGQNSKEPAASGHSVQEHKQQSVQHQQEVFHSENSVAAVQNNTETMPSQQKKEDEKPNQSPDFMAEYYARKAELAQKVESQKPAETAEQESQTTLSDQKETDTAVNQSEEEASSQIAESVESEEEKYNRSLKKTRTGFGARLNAFLANFRNVDEEFFEDLEEMLILSDVGVQVASTLTEDLRYEAKLEKAKKPEALRRVIIEKLVDIYDKDGQFNEKINFQNDLTVMLFVGVNGVGKTTSIGKLAYKYKHQGKKVMLVAADTFRAGAVAQLAEWGRRVDVPVVTGPKDADPASVVYDGVERAVAADVDILMIDTAGRLQNKDNLMAELEKIGRVVKRVIPDAPHETLLTLDASTGQNALVQAKEFSKITPLTGLILTKIDGTAKGGVVLAIRQELAIPVKFIGFGEKIDDIGEFHSEDFMRGLLEGLL